MKRGHSIAGKRYGRLVAVERVPALASSCVWRVQCDCGAEIKVEAVRLYTGQKKSCGCYATNPLGLRRDGTPKRASKVMRDR